MHLGNHNICVTCFIDIRFISVAWNQTCNISEVCLCMCIYAYIRVCICIYIYMHLYVYICIYMYICI